MKGFIEITVKTDKTRKCLINILNYDYTEKEGCCFITCACDVKRFFTTVETYEQIKELIKQAQ